MIYSLDILLSQFETSLCSMFSSDCCFLTCIQVSQEEVKVIWYSLLFKNFPRFIVIHRVKDFSIVSDAEADVFLEFSCLFYNATDVSSLSLGPLPFLNPA